MIKASTNATIAANENSNAVTNNRKPTSLKSMIASALLSAVIAISAISVPGNPAFADESESITASAQAAKAVTNLKDKMRGMVKGNQVERLTEIAQSLEGTPYVYGGTTPSGFDCSGFVGYCYREALGIELPRTSQGQSAMGLDIPLDQLQPGDILCWGAYSVYHVGIYLGDDKYIHAAGSGMGVRIDGFEWYSPTSARRIL